jgi:putative SOS response-associated peptidase YedK
MCGRYYRMEDKQKIAEAFHANVTDDGTPSPPWDYNVAPTTPAVVVRVKDHGILSRETLHQNR